MTDVDLYGCRAIELSGAGPRSRQVSVVHVLSQEPSCSQVVYIVDVSRCRYIRRRMCGQADVAVVGL